MDDSAGTRSPQPRPNSHATAKRNSENVDRILRRARKVRQPKACYPCRRRKVKCSGIPCSNCALRGYPELCSMNPEDIPIEDLSERGRDDNTSDVSNTSPLPPVTPHQQDDEVNNGQKAWQAKSVDEDSYVPTQYAPPPVPHVSPELARSSTSKVQELEDGTFKTTVPVSARSPRDSWVKKIYENVGLQDSSSNYPFENFWSPQKSVEELCLALPSNAHIQRYYQVYREIMLPVFPGLVDAPAFEVDLQLFLEQRDRVIVDISKTQFEFSWLSLLFSVLACGAQCLGSTDKEAELNSKVFVSIAFQLLRLGNFLVLPNMNIVQSLVLMGSCVRNDLNPGITWSLLGITIRLAQIVGCHERHAFFDHTGMPQHEKILKSKLWWAIVWQDSFLGFCFDRPSGTTTVRVPLPPVISPDGKYNYIDCVNRICDAIQNFCRHKALLNNDDETLSYEFVTGLIQDIGDIEKNALPHLRTNESCINLQEYLEYLAVRIYVNHIISQFAWSILRSPLPIDADIEACLTDIIFKKCVAVLEHILKLRQVSVLTSHYWSILHAAVKSTEFLASNLQEDDMATRDLVKRLIRSLECSCDDSVGSKSSFALVLSRTVKDLKALLENHS